MAQLGVVNRLINYLEHACPCVPASLSVSSHLHCFGFLQALPLGSLQHLGKKSVATTFGLTMIWNLQYRFSYFTPPILYHFFLSLNPFKCTGFPALVWTLGNTAWINRKAIGFLEVNK